LESHYLTAEQFATMAFSIGTLSRLPKTFADSIFEDLDKTDYNA
jgi:hypothetical protein